MAPLARQVPVTSSDLVRFAISRQFFAMPSARFCAIPDNGVERFLLLSRI